MSRDEQKVIHYGHKVKINIGLIIFIIMFLYMCFSAYTYLHKNKISFYEVTEGGMAKDNQHVGIIMREESTQYADKSGYVNFFITNGKRAAVGSDIYSIDETGALTSYLNNADSTQLTISDENLGLIQKELSGFSSEFRDENFGQLYDFKTITSSSVLDYASADYFRNLDEVLENNGISFNRVYSPESGIVGLDIDGFEDRTPESITQTDFDKTGYSSSHLKSGQLVEQNDPVYKLVTSETWSVLFPLTEEERMEYSEKNELKVSFKGTNLTATGKYIQSSGTDGKYYGQIVFDRYMVDFIDDRYLTFEIEDEAQSGLKIPKSAVVSKLFMTIPVEYLARGGDGIEEGFYKSVPSDNGQTAVVFVPTDIYYTDGASYYIGMDVNSQLQPGDYVVMPGTNETYRLGSTASLEGVYNINKGYAVFKQIEVLDSNDEYYTVKKNRKYGLLVYDHILFDPAGIKEGDFIYQ